jgi:glycosyltransferase involved in cell wall biosynthesis
MKILMLAQYFPPDMGGGSTRISNVVDGLLRKNCDVTIVAAVPNYPHGKIPKRYKSKAIVHERFGAAKVYRVWIPALPHSNSINRLTLHFCFMLSSLFALPFVGETDVIWGVNPNLFSFFPSFVYGVFKHAPIVRNVDDLWPEVFYELGYVKSRIVSKVLNFTAWLSYVIPVAITPISEGYKHVIVAKYGVPSAKIHVVEVGVKSVKSLISKNKSNDLFTVVYSGILGFGYDFDIILKSAKLLEKETNIRILVRGVGELAQSLKGAICDRGLRNVMISTDFLPFDKLSILLASADVFLLPMACVDFVDQGLPAKVFEYQAYGKPIVCSSKGESRNYIVSSNSGLVVNPGDSAAFAQAIMTLYNDKALAESLGLNGWKYVSNNLTSEHVGERIYSIFESAHALKKDLIQ